MLPYHTNCVLWGGGVPVAGQGLVLFCWHRTPPISSRGGGAVVILAGLGVVRAVVG